MWEKNRIVFKLNGRFSFVCFKKAGEKLGLFFYLGNEGKKRTVYDIVIPHKFI
jgi:hypothetical protein